jgi:hypothetical protein
MEEIRIQAIIKRGGELSISGLPLSEGQEVEVIVHPMPYHTAKSKLTARALLESGLVGLWKDRTDIGDSAEYARMLRERAQRRQDRE